MKIFGFIDNRLIKIELLSQKYQIATSLQFFNNDSIMKNSRKL